MLNITTAGNKYNMYKMSNKSNNGANGFATIANKICNNGIRFVSIVVLFYMPFHKGCTFFSYGMYSFINTSTYNETYVNDFSPKTNL